MLILYVTHLTISEGNNILTFQKQSYTEMISCANPWHGFTSNVHPPLRLTCSMNVKNGRGTCMWILDMILLACDTCSIKAYSL